MAMHFNNHLSESEALKKWIAVGGEELRLDYPLADGDLVFDVGGHCGDWAADILARYNPRLWIFEPVAAHVAQLHERFDGDPRVRILPVAAGIADQKVKINLNGTGSTLLGQSGNTEEIDVINLCNFVVNERLDEVTLCKINIEGLEFDLLDLIIQSGVVERIRDLQIQFHDVFPEAKKRRDSIREKLTATHRLSYDYPFVWENWTRLGR
jgi:FkbM family methyltransferase